MQDYEQLGAFYLGRVHDPAVGETRPEYLLYDAKDLTTHAVCVGMTGSGKTGLCVGLLEEAAIDGIPALIVDPKGDLGNLLLTFPTLRPEDFAPWVDAQEAARKGKSVQDHAASLADLWKKGLGDWDQQPDRIARLKASVETAIYTPGTTAGRPLSVLRSMDAPREALRSDTTAMRDRILSAVSGLLGLVGIGGDPITSREHILLSTILDLAWSKGENLDLTDLIHRIQKPPFERVGVFDLETFYPAADRLKLAMTLNNLMVSPGFSAWMAGEPLSIQDLLYTKEGKPRHAILSIAHLSDAERMFFVTTLLNELVAWMRTQPGTSSLRALLYMDEIFGYFPPTANPPSKGPMLTLLKQARAFGVGVVLATQNPVDLDYKGLSNCGTWFIGRLQTDRDKARILDGLESAGGEAGFDRGELDRLIANLGSRVFLMRNVHDRAPTLFQTRWVMSYLRGPMTLDQIKQLAEPPKPATVTTDKVPKVTAAPTAPTEAEPPAPSAAARPVVPEEYGERFFALDAASVSAGVVYRPTAYAVVRLHYALARANLDTWDEAVLMAPIGKRGIADWEKAVRLAAEPAMATGPSEPCTFEDLPSGLSAKGTRGAWDKMLKSHVYSELAYPQLYCRDPRGYSDEGETERDFVARLSQVLREERDLQIGKLKASYETKVQRLEARILKAEQQMESYEGKVREQHMSTIVNLGTTVLGALLGRRSVGVGTVRRASTTLKSAGRISGKKEKVEQAKERLEALQAEMKALDAAFREEHQALMAKDHAPEIEHIPVHPRKSDILPTVVALAWAPWVQGIDGQWTLAARVERKG